MFITDFDECVNNNGGCKQLCYNLVPGYHCDCQEGYVLADDGHTCNGYFRVCQSSLFNLVHSSSIISDINECLSDPCDFYATCVNTNGSFVCTCDNHFKGSGFYCTRVCENGYQLNESSMACCKLC